MVHKRNVYPNMKSLEAARHIVLEAFGDHTPGMEVVPTPEAVGRVLAEPVAARLSSPHFHAAAMDGIAVRATDTFGAHPSKPRPLTVGQTAFYVNTGHVLPPRTDAVIMIENVQEGDDGRVVIEAPAFPWNRAERPIAIPPRIPTPRRRPASAGFSALVAAALRVFMRIKP